MLLATSFFVHIPSADDSIHWILSDKKSSQRRDNLEKASSKKKARNHRFVA